MFEHVALLWFQFWVNHTGIGAKAALVCVGALAERRLLRTSVRTGRILRNTALFFGWILGVSLVSVAVALLLLRFPGAHYGLLRTVSWPLPFKCVVAFFLLDLTNYAVHRLEHALPWVWHFHSLHHSDEHLDVSTALRKHPVSGLFTTTCFVAVALALGIPPIAALVYNVAADAVGVLAHSGFRWPLPWAQRVQALRLVRPEDHRLHHSEDQPETDSNFGQVFTLWDRMFGTYRERKDLENVRIGLKHVESQSAGLTEVVAT